MVPNLWRAVDLGAPVVAIKPDIPNVNEVVLRPEVQALLYPYSESLRGIFARCIPPEVIKDETAFLVHCLYSVIQSHGASLAAAMDAEDLTAASTSVTAVATLLEACGGGTLCPVHEPYLLAYLNAVAARG